MIRTCKHCQDEFDSVDKIRRLGGYVNVCHDCHLEMPDPDKNTPVLRAVTTGDGKMAAITILKFKSENDADAYVKSFNSNTGWNNRRTGGMNDIEHQLVAENFGNTNHKGKL